VLIPGNSAANTQIFRYQGEDVIEAGKLMGKGRFKRTVDFPIAVRTSRRRVEKRRRLGKLKKPSVIPQPTIEDLID